MYHSVIGKRLVSCLNARDGTNYTVREFFDNIYVDLFYGEPRMLMHPGNSEIGQRFIIRKQEFSRASLQDAMSSIHVKISNSMPDASIHFGGFAAESTATTSGQVTSFGIPIPDEDIYASWIGASLGLTVQGGLTLLIDADDALLATYDSWHAYRKFLDQTPLLMPLKVNSWNGQWVAWRLSEPDAKQPDNFLEKDAKGNLAPKPVKWSKLMFALSFYYAESNIQRLLAYVYSLGQSNKTIGFVQLNLPAARRPVTLYKQLYQVPEGMQFDPFLKLYETEESFEAACARTEIGLRSLKPKDVFNARNAVPKYPNASEPEKRIVFNIYQTWIIAMLNNKDLPKRAEAVAAALDDFRKQGNKRNNTDDQAVKNLLEKRSYRDFIEASTVILAKGSGTEILDQVIDDMSAMPRDIISLFLTLVRFKYAVITAKQKDTDSQ